MADDLRSRAERLRADRRPFVTATVVRAERPTSAKPGDSALVLDDGTVVGFVGGECAHTSVQVQALAALDSGDPLLLRITPEAEPSGAARQEPEAGTVTVHNPCLSGGALEIFLEPSVPPALVVVHGDAPMARAIRELAGWLGFDARAPEGEIRADTAAVVVASHGGSEVAIIEAALRAGVPYVGLVASPRRGAAVLGGLRLSEDERARIHTPAGIDIGSRTPQEVALSVLAQIVAARPRPTRPARGLDEPAGSTATAATATDPVCGMEVAAIDASRHADHAGTRYWFCGPGCEDAFRADPDAFVPR
jgi:xanthine dehydrogenase accessory factor